jgi:hypothetical protein
VHAAFGTVVVVVSVVAIVLAVIALARSGHTWSDYGKGRLVMDRDLTPAPSPASPAAAGEREAEIRSLLEARNARRLRRGEEPVDIEAELARLTAPEPAFDPGLRDEVRQLVVARNLRRERAGQPPLDVEAEVERELRRLTEL